MDGPAKGKRTDTHKRRRSTKLFGNCIVLNKSKKYSRSKTRRTGKLDKEKTFPEMFSTTQSMQQGKSQKFAGNGRTLDFKGKGAGLASNVSM